MEPHASQKGLVLGPPAAGLDGERNVSPVLGWMGLFYANSVGNKDVHCSERIDTGYGLRGCEKVRRGQFWDRCRVLKRKGFAPLDWLWAAVRKVDE